jgi:putative tryptophan/tyrosine transport system substrate-binding protein
MKRREFIGGLGAATWSVVARAQQGTVPVIGFLSPGSAATRQITLAAVRQGLAQLGYVEDQNLTIEYRWAGERNELLPELAAELVRRQVSAIIALGGERGGLAAKSVGRQCSLPRVANFGRTWSRQSRRAGRRQPWWAGAR